MPFPILIISHYFAWSFKDVREGLTHRYFGLYSNIARYVLTHGEVVYWYGVKEQKLLRIFDGKIYSSRYLVMPIAVMSSLRELFTHRKPIIVILDYPHSFLGIKHFPLYVITLIILHVFRLFKLVFIVVDNMDPPIEHALELKKKISMLEKILWIFLNNVVFGFDFIIFLSQSYRVYHKLYYKLNYTKTDVCPLGSFPSKIPYKGASLKPPLKVLLLGRIEEWIGLKTLGALIKDLEYEDIKVKLIVIDKSAPNSLKENSIEVINTYIDYSELVKLLGEAQVLLLLRPRSLHQLLTVRATLLDYMMAGRPILYLHSLGSKEIVDDLKGCYSFNSLNEVSSILKQLYMNMSVINELGKKIREYAEKHFNYEVLALNLLKKIVCRLRSRYIRR